MSKKSDIKKKKIIVIAFLILILLLIISIIYGIVLLFNKKNINSNISDINETLHNSEFINEIQNEAIPPVEDEPTVNPTVDISPSPTSSSEKNKSNTSYNTKYYVKVNLAANVVNVYTKDSNGDYTVPVKGFICSTGTATPKSGVYKATGYKRRWNHLQGNVDGQYATQIVGNILFHSVPYTKQDVSALEYWEYDKLGTSASLGCIRMTVADVKWIYDNITKGTPIEFYSDSKNPGPFGKPKAQKISNNIECRNWDPTDFADGNPWKKQKSSPAPAVSPTPTTTPTPTLKPTTHPTLKPTTHPTVMPTAKPTIVPTKSPAPTLSSKPSLIPSPIQTPEPTPSITPASVETTEQIIKNNTNE